MKCEPYEAGVGDKDSKTGVGKKALWMTQSNRIFTKTL